MTFFEFCQDSGYDKILQVLGATPRDFLQVNFTLCHSKFNISIAFPYKCIYDLLAKWCTTQKTLSWCWSTKLFQNLDGLHDHLGTLYPGMRAPSFRCTERPEDGALVLHYYSDRPGLEHIVIGIVKVWSRIRIRNQMKFIKQIVPSYNTMR